MSFDLAFCRQDKSAPSIPELKEYFSSFPLFQVTDVAAGGVEFSYHNEATGVYCTFSYSPLDAAESKGCGSTGLTLNLNYNRPSFFAYETMPLVEAFCRHFNLLVEDSQEETVGPADAARLISSWRHQNTGAMRTFKKLAKEEGMELHYLPEASATAWWSYAKVQQQLEEAILEDIFVPSPLILQNPANELFTLLLWPDGISQFFPRSDYVYLEREKKSLFKTKKEAGLISYDLLMGKIGHLLDDYAFGELQLKYLRPEKTFEVGPLIESFNLEQLDLRRFTRIASDDFHDVGDSESRSA